MTTSSFDPPGANDQESTEPQTATPTPSLKDHLSGLAESAEDSLSFFKLVAVDLQRRFGASIVFVGSPQWPVPIVYGRNDTLLHSLDFDVLETLLASATASPMCCDVPLIPASAMESPRALRVQLAAAPHPVAAMIVHHRSHRAAGLKQVEDLRQLQSYALVTGDIVASVATVWQKADPTGPIESATSSESQSSSQRTLRSFHHSLDLTETCYRIANESRRLIQCDRVTVLVPCRSRYQVRSVSGVAVVDRRSNHIRALESLANAAVILDHSLAVPSDEAIPPQVQEPLDSYLDESGISSALLIPLRRPDPPTVEDESRGRAQSTRQRPLGIIVLENFSGQNLSDQASSSSSGQLDVMTKEASIALRNAIEHQSVFGLTLWKAIGRLTRSSRLSLWSVGAVAAIALLAAGFLVRVEHYVVAKGTAEPEIRRELFAAIDGSVQNLSVHDGQHVAKGDLLIQLENPELENRAEALAGQIQTAVGRLASIQALRLSAKDQDSQLDRLVLEQRQLESELANLREQQQILKTQMANLSVTSPIDGTAVAWQIERRLTGRPVNRGDLLCSVVDTHGTWQLRLTVPERNAGPILDAAKQRGALSVRFAVATMPEQTFQAEVKDLSRAARLDANGTRVIDLIATVTSGSDGSFDAHNPSNNASPTATSPGSTSLRVGADVTAKVECGQRRLVHSWFSDVVDFVHRNVLFRWR